MSERDRVAEIVKGAVKEVFEEREALMELGDDDQLFDSIFGLDSLDFAVVVVKLQLEFNVDPFEADDFSVEQYPSTMNELIDLYVLASGNNGLQV